MRSTRSAELRTTYDSIRDYQTAVYYAGDWRPEFERWARMQAGLYAGPGREVVAWHQALTFDMLMWQPVVHELPLLRVPTTLFVGVHDRTALGRGAAAPEMQAKLGDYRALGRQAADAIPGAVLVEYEDLGHSPHIQAPDRFHRDLLAALSPAGRRGDQATPPRACNGSLRRETHVGAAQRRACMDGSTRYFSPVDLRSYAARMSGLSMSARLMVRV
jgi:hypothetical protein